MKRIIILMVFLFAGAVVFGQTNLKVNDRAAVFVSDTISDANITGADTSVTYHFPKNANSFSVQATWTHLQGDGGDIFIEVSDDNSNWSLYDSDATDTMDDSDASLFFDSGSNIVSWEYWRVRCDTANVILTVYVIPKK